MRKFQIDFRQSGQAVGWFTYDIWAPSVFDAACELFQIVPDAVITNIFEGADHV